MADAKTEAQRAAKKAVSEARNLKHEAEGTIEHYRNQAARFQDNLMAEVQDKPLRTLGIAVAIGFALGAIYKI